MRPVNLIPAEARGSDRAPMRAGGVSYMVIAALALALLAVIAIAFTNKQISNRENEVTRLNQELQAATARAQSLDAFASFAAVEELRTATVSSLAQTRFDWERVLNELALVIPEDAWLTELSGTVNPAVQIDTGPDLQLRDSITGPALEIVGCASGQDAVAGFVADLEDIDGVTRVGVAASQRPEEIAADAAAAEVGSDSAGSNGECRTEDFIARFEIVVAFDAVPVPGSATAVPSVPGSLDGSGTGEVAAAQAQQAANQAETAQASSEATEATNLIPGG